MIDHARAEDWTPTLVDGSVQLLILDPPYFRVMAEAWDRQWKTAAEYLGWLGEQADEWRRVLAPNGSLYVFASPEMAARVEVLVIAERFEVLNRIRWMKEDGWHKKAKKEELRAYLSPWEEVIFAELPEDASRIRAYLNQEREAAGFSVQDVAEAWRVRTGNANRTGMAGHWFSAVQWALPTAEVYGWLREQFNRDGDYKHLRRDYKHLRRDYKHLRRPFEVSADVPHTDVWTYPTVEPGPGRHPCEKPLPMLRDMIRASSRQGDLVVDTFAGSGSTCAAAIDTGRKFAGCEMGADWVELGNDRAERHLSIVERRPVEGKRPAGTISGPLFGGMAGG